ncbi:glutamyl-tRNA reductase [Petroclostridium sp. X23]|uniref:glutamyl-tRNA reductase n=1 Tax=Petroclostridium sp. X23 TaxID=3045146 RepID=UPI0024ACA62B|nr:glutamyl-tRNA reductase [Petroclostridium sp. X23]WHH59210.1 glutamyl-tRNA reductase [Petroclostridium sp. X23]
MNIVVMGIDHLTPIEIREKASYTSGKYSQACDYLNTQLGVDGFIILSTCNRSEIYCQVSEIDIGQKILFDFYANFHGIDETDIRKYSYYKYGEQAILHLFDVACGLKSLVIGEDQILGQIKTAHREAMHAKHTSAVLNRLFFTAVTASKEVKSKTGISKSSLSISSIGVKFIEDYFERKIQDKKVLVIGTGKMGRLAVKKLICSGVNNIMMTNRTHHHAVQFQKEVSGAVTISYERRYEYINDIDVVISCTSSPHYTITYEMLRIAKNEDKELCLLDLAVPRDIEKEIGCMKGIHLFTIDDLDKVVKRNLKKRLDDSIGAQRIIDCYYNGFMEWLARYESIQDIKNVHIYGRSILERQYQYAVKKMKISDERQKAVMYKILKNSIDSIVNPIMENTKVECQNKSVNEFLKEVFNK